MKYLVFLICFAFGSLFHFLYTRSIGKDFFFRSIGWELPFSWAFWNFLGETILFCIGGILLFFLFSDISKEKDEFGFKKTNFEPKSIIDGLKKFFSKYIYFVWFLLFYSAIYLILDYFWVDFHYFVLLVNIFVGVLFFLNDKFFIFRDLIKVSTILSSLYFIGFYIFTFSQNTVIYTWIDFVNSILILWYFILNIYFDKKYLKKHESDTGLSIYFFLYLYLFVSFYLFLTLKTLSFIFSLTGLLFTFLLFYYIPLFTLFRKNTIPLRFLSLFTSYTSLLFSLYYLLFEGFSLIIVCIILLLCGFNLYVHFRFQNYISFILSLLGLSTVFYVLYFEYFFTAFDGYKSLFVATYILTAVYILFSYFKKFFHIIDYIILYICCYIANIYGLVYYFFAGEFDILTFWIMLLLESIVIFMSYYKVNSLLPKDEEYTEETHHHNHNGHH